MSARILRCLLCLVFAAPLACKEKDAEKSASASKAKKDGGSGNGGSGNGGSGEVAAAGARTGGGSESADATNGGGGGSPNLKPKYSLTQLKKDDIPFLVDGLNAVESHSRSDEGPDDGSCFGKSFSNGKVKATDKSITYEVDADAAKCLPELFEGATNMKLGKVKSYTIKVKGTISCDQAAGLAKFDGKSFKDLHDSQESKNDDWCDGGAYSTGQESASEVEYEVESFGKKQQIKTSSYSATAAPDGGPCRNEVAGGEFTIPKCLDTSVENDDVAKSSTLTIVEQQNAKSKAKERFFRSGKAKLTLNEWKGEMTFQGANEAPKWTLSSGAQDLSGTFGASKNELESGADPEAPKGDGKSAGLALTGDGGVRSDAKRVRIPSPF